MKVNTRKPILTQSILPFNFILLILHTYKYSSIYFFAYPRFAAIWTASSHTFPISYIKTINRQQIDYVY